MTTATAGSWTPLAGSDERREDRIAGALVGLAAGDALGAGYEFGPPVTSRIEMKGGGHFGWERGEFTDDTQMAICIAESSTHGSIDLDQTGDRFIAWAKDAKDVGNQTRDVLSRAENGAELPAISKERFERLPQRSAGNGSLMRTGAVALAFHDDVDGAVAAARDVSDLTHGDPQCADACVLWTAGIVTAINTGTVPDLRDGLEWLPAERRDMWRAIIDRAEAEGPNTFYPNGYAVLAFQAAWSAITHTMPGPHHYRDGVTRAVSIGNDTDTVAAIAGTMLGAAYGMSAIPEEWLYSLHGWPRGNSSRFGWDYRCYTVVDVACAARDAAGLRVPERRGWRVDKEEEIRELFDHLRTLRAPAESAVTAPGDRQPSKALHELRDTVTTRVHVWEPDLPRWLPGELTVGFLPLPATTIGVRLSVKGVPYLAGDRTVWMTHDYFGGYGIGEGCYTAYDIWAPRSGAPGGFAHVVVEAAERDDPALEQVRRMAALFGPDIQDLEETSGCTREMLRPPILPPRQGRFIPVAEDQPDRSTAELRDLGPGVDSFDREQCPLCGTPHKNPEIARAYVTKLCRECDWRALTFDGKEPEMHIRDGDVFTENPVYVDGQQCWRRFKFGGWVTMLDPWGCRTLSTFYKMIWGEDWAGSTYTADPD